MKVLLHCGLKNIGEIVSVARGFVAVPLALMELPLGSAQAPLPGLRNHIRRVRSCGLAPRRSARAAYRQLCGAFGRSRDLRFPYRSSLDSPLEGTGFEPSVPLLRKALLGVANRRRRHERRSHLQVQARDGNACLEWLPIAFPLGVGPRIRIRLPPGKSQANFPTALTRPNRSHLRAHLHRYGVVLEHTREIFCRLRG